ncbi:hypothetical protein [Dictyobacter kobayashii]|uniref:hypothetical protein n=1 Tax=Dictyobacter kobayashii TaxID=2014872 RepID=UPI000F83D815|nr:hypothetical protein [Dictyobacter kobayashii]
MGLMIRSFLMFLFGACGAGLGVWSMWWTAAAAHHTPERRSIVSLARDLWTNSKKTVDNLA